MECRPFLDRVLFSFGGFFLGMGLPKVVLDRHNLTLDLQRD